MPLRDIAFPPKDQPLREDVGKLGDLVGGILREQGGEGLFSRVETARLAAIRRREGDGAPSAAEELRHALHALDAREATELVRAFSTYFQVVNLAERVHRIRRGRWWMRSDDPQSGSLADTVRRLRDMGFDRAQASAFFTTSRVEPVFTAHPTESTRRAILEKQERIAVELLSRLNPERTPREERVAWARIRENVTTSWQTEEHPSARPTVADEREHVLYYVSHVLYRVLPALSEALRTALDEAYGPEEEDEAMTPALVRPGSWVGGDMDGNPFVTSATVRETLHRHRDLALDAYARELDDLAGHLTQSETRVDWSPELTARIRRYGAWFPDVMEAVPARHRGMGYRVFLKLVRARLSATRSDSAHGYEGPSGLEDDVMAVADSLLAHRGSHAGVFRVRRLLERVRAFGFHLATLDVRQDARALRDVMAELRGDPDWQARDPEERADALRGELTASDFESVRARYSPTSDSVRETLDVFRAVAEARRVHGPDAIGYYIISMAQDVDDVLTVLWLAALSGSGAPDALKLDVAPLFETVPDLEHAEAVLDRMFTDPYLRPHLRRRDGRQLVMVGYSDSNKDGGVFSARWALQRAMERMAEAAGRHDVTLTVFHGRGGTVSRGGGSVHRAVAAMPSRSIGGRLRLTEQGEVIDAKYGLPQIALRELERMLGSIALKAADPGRGTPDEWRAMAETMAESARGAYRALVYEHPRFTEYFRSGTPIDVIERMTIGSRPSSRRSGAGVEDLRAIPWVFSWTQCRAMITGWYGLGAGLQAAREKHGMSALREAAEGWPFFDALLADVEMVLAKADLEIAAMYRPLAPDDSEVVFEAIREEFEQTVAAVLEVREADMLLERDATLQRSIRLRNPYVDPMNILQVDLLARWRSEGRPDGPLLDGLLATVNGIARGLQNTG